MKPLCLGLLLLLCAPWWSMAGAFEDDAGAESQCTSLLEAWHKPDAKRDEEARSALIEAAVRTDRPQIIEEVAAGGDPALLEIKPPANVKEISISIVRDCGEMENGVFRRMTKTHFEAWTSAHGWLFNSKGKCVHEAIPPRRDGTGRKWYGAFLPDGRWVTTDLWEHDCTLSFFSPDGKWLKESPSEKLAPPQKGNDDNGEGNTHGHDLIGWARCDRNGKGWVVSIGSEAGRARVFVMPSGKVRLMETSQPEAKEPHSKPWNEPWKLCYPRDLEPKGYYIALYRPSDDFQSQISMNRPGHGMWSGYPSYGWGETGGVILPEGDHNFGFLPGSHDVYIGTEWSSEAEHKTWFFAADGKCRGWVKAAYLTDSVDGKAIWLLNKDNGVVTLGLDLKPQSLMRFTINSASAKPVKLFPDLRLGFFALDEDKIVLARW